MKLRNEYHDATLVAVRISGDQMTLVTELDGHWNNQCEQRAYLVFYSVKNLVDLCATLGIAKTDGETKYRDEIIGVVKVDKTQYRVDLQVTQTLEIDCRGLSEI